VTGRINLVGLVVSVLLLVAVLDLVRRRRLAEEYSFVWIAFAAALVALSLRRDVLDRAASWLDIYYPPVVLLLVLILMVFVASLGFSVVVSRQRKQIDRLIEHTAVLDAELQELRGRGTRAEEVPPSSKAAGERAGPYRPAR
jgi:type II secretory pathway pseudopilin PulG